MYIVILDFGTTKEEMLYNKDGDCEVFASRENAQEIADDWIKAGNAENYEVFEKCEKLK